MPDYFFIRQDGRYVKILFSEILFLESRRNYVRLVLTKGTHLTQMAMKQFDRFLPSDRFCRVHRSYIVGMDFVQCFDQNTITIAGAFPAKQYQLPIGEKYRQSLVDSVLIATADGREAGLYKGVTVEELLLEGKLTRHGHEDIDF